MLLICSLGTHRPWIIHYKPIETYFPYIHFINQQNRPSPHIQSISTRPRTINHSKTHSKPWQKHKTHTKRINMMHSKLIHSQNRIPLSTTVNLSRTNRNNRRTIIGHYRIASNRNQSPASRTAKQFPVFDAPKCIRLIKKLPFGRNVCPA